MLLLFHLLEVFCKDSDRKSLGWVLEASGLKPPTSTIFFIGSVCVPSWPLQKNDTSGKDRQSKISMDWFKGKSTGNHRFSH
jgi:hypothetical protein